MDESLLNRRTFLAGTGMLALGACSSGSINSHSEVDAEVDSAVAMMHDRLPFSREMSERAVGILMMPGIYKGGFIVGGAYGEGALRLGRDQYRQTADYYSFAGASFGFQAGLQKTGHALFFMTESSLDKFRSSSNFEVGADAEVTLIDTGFKADLNTTIAQKPIVAVVFDQKGLLAGASLEGAKYTRIAA